MSGTSLDGVDVANCEFFKEDKKWQFKIFAAETIVYSNFWKQKLKTAHQISGFDLSMLHVEFGNYLGVIVNEFIKRNGCQPEFIASHGHTVFHQPEKGMTLQIGDGSAIVAKTGIDVINDFRTLDVALGGQGAPLVPVGDQEIFADYEFCLNLGGFANISFQDKNKRIAFDICPANIALNHFANKAGFDFDKDGNLAKDGKVNGVLLKSLNRLPFYYKKPPKSLGREWLGKEFMPVLSNSNLLVPDILSTLTEHIAMQTAMAVWDRPTGKMLVTGGGAQNCFLIERLRYHSLHQIVIPDEKCIHFKEALVFAFLGVLRLMGESNCLCSVTGARHDCCSGTIYKA